MGLPKRGKHINATCDVPTDNKSKLSEAHDETVGSIIRTGDVHTIDKIVPSHHRSTDARISTSTDTRISNNNIITSNINELSTRNRANPALDLANLLEIVEWTRFQLKNHHEYPHFLVTVIVLNVRCRHT